MRAGILLAWGLVAVMAGHATATAIGFAGLSGPTLVTNTILLVVETLLGLFAALLALSLGKGRSPTAGPPAQGHVVVLIPVRNDGPVLDETLRAATALVDPGNGYTVVVADDSDPSCTHEIRRLCEAHGVTYYRRLHRRGRKAGALNDALGQHPGPFVAVLDADHVARPDFLVNALSLLGPRDAFVQTCLEWRNESSTLRRLAGLLQHQFYYGVQYEKGTRGRAVWTGSGAVFRRRALDEVGGFPEDTLVEDFDLTILLTNAGWHGRLSTSVGASGLLPWTTRDIARQLWRWSHGTSAAVRLRWRATLTSPQAPLTARLELLADGLAYLASGAFVAALALLSTMALASLEVVRPLGGWTLLLAPTLVAAVHTYSALDALRRRGTAAPSTLAFYHLVSLAFTPIVLAGALAGLLGVGSGFEGRVSKTDEDAHPTDALLALVFSASLGIVAAAALFRANLPLAAVCWLLVLTASSLVIPMITAPEYVGAVRRSSGRADS